MTRPIAAGLGLAALAFWQSAALAAVQPPEPVSATVAGELKRLRALETNGAVVRKRPAGCTSSQSRQFDFWLGEWDVSMTGTTELVAESSIVLADQGCVILEHWRPFQGASGHSINGYDSESGQWKQTWIDATGRISPYAGRMIAGTLIMEDLGSQQASGSKFAKRRMSFRAIDDSSVRQWGEGWDEKGHTWVVTWDLTYSRRPGTRADRP